MIKRKEVIVFVKNVGLLTVKKTDAAQEQYTPYYAVQPLLKYISKDKVIWCPMDLEFSAYYNVFKQNGYNVIRSHILERRDFYEYEPKGHYDIIVTNPPFNQKERIFKRLCELDKPFAILLPLHSLQGSKIYQYFSKLKNGIQILAFDKRIGFHKFPNINHIIEGTPFACCYFCNRVLPKDLILEHIEKFDKPLFEENDNE